MERKIKKQRNKDIKAEKDKRDQRRIKEYHLKEKKRRNKDVKAKKLRLNNEQNIICKENIKKSRNKERTKERKKHTKKQRKRCYRDVELEYYRERKKNKQ